MNASSTGPRSKQQLSESFMSHVNSYALAAGAAGVTVMALAQPSEAEIVYTPANKSLPYHRLVSVDLNHDGTPDFGFFLNSWSFLYFYGSLNVTPQGAGGVIESAGGYASALVKGATIGPRQKVKDGKRIELVVSHGSHYGYSYHRSVIGPWTNAQNRYLGVAFTTGGATHYGWIRLTVGTTKAPLTATITGYAYETVADRPIHAGQLREEASALELSPRAQPSLGTLALGSRGLDLWRREEAPPSP